VDSRDPDIPIIATRVKFLYQHVKARKLRIPELRIPAIKLPNDLPTDAASAAKRNWEIKVDE